MAQIMYYHRAPKSSTPEIPGRLLFNAGGWVVGRDEPLPPVTFDWKHMKTSYANGYTEQEKKAVAQLMLYCGWAVDMNYGISYSGASSSDAAKKLKNCFGYDDNIQYIRRNNYTDAEWENTIYAELQAQRPVLYCGNDATEGGHAFICDGYDGSGRFHLNWGFKNGTGNGYYILSLANTQGYQFSRSQEAAIGISSSDSALEPIAKADDKEREYGEANPDLTFHWGNHLIPQGTPVLNCDATLKSQVGSYPIIISKGSIEGNVTLTNGTLTVTKAPLTISVRDTTIIEGNPIPTTFNVDYQGFKNGEDKSDLYQLPRFSCSANANSKPGTYPITVKDASSPNYNISYAGGTLTIVKKPIYELQIAGEPTINAGPATTINFTIKNSGGKAYNEQIRVVTYGPNSTYLQTANGNSIQADVYLKQTIAAGGETTFNITYVDVPSDKLFTTTIWYWDDEYNTWQRVRPVKDLYFKWEDRSVTIVADNKTRQYGEQNPLLTYAVTSKHQPTGQPNINCEADYSSHVGEYAIKLERGSIEEEDLTLTDGILTVTKAPLTISVGTYTIKQGDPLPEYALTYSGWKNNEDKNELIVKPTVSCDATNSDVPGAYDIIISGAEAQNYEFNYVAGTLTIVPEPVNLVMEATVKNATEWIDWVGQVEDDQAYLKIWVKNAGRYPYDGTVVVKVFKIAQDGYGYEDRIYRETLKLEPEGETVMELMFEKEAIGLEYFYYIYYLDDDEEVQGYPYSPFFTFVTPSDIATLRTTAPDKTVYVYSTGGQLLRQTAASNLGRMLKSLPKGIYVVKTEVQKQKGERGTKIRN